MISADRERLLRLATIRERVIERHDGSGAEWLSVLLELRRREQAKRKAKE